eukprot:CAMPEP_0117540848 /NCGR_PEP_ID=MMETSP0784-20121206/43711_1 /TAXON_ID=39447 /ORGANISM="" /LENGTH=177 /DNA_ID=CAMNT_0005337517 /DNA_START=9 /DNA_END=540 /DNA_ORIENTATION=+
MTRTRLHRPPSEQNVEAGTGAECKGRALALSRVALRGSRRCLAKGWLNQRAQLRPLPGDRKRPSAIETACALVADELFTPLEVGVLGASPRLDGSVATRAKGLLPPGAQKSAAAGVRSDLQLPLAPFVPREPRAGEDSLLFMSIMSKTGILESRLGRLWRLQPREAGTWTPPRARPL